MLAGSTHPELTEHLVATTRLGPGEARRVVDDVVAYFSEPVDHFVRRRHRELHRQGLVNAEIFDRITEELAARPVAPPSLSSRQLRRLVYG